MKTSTLQSLVGWIYTVRLGVTGVNPLNLRQLTLLVLVLSLSPKDLQHSVDHTRVRSHDVGRDSTEKFCGRGRDSPEEMEQVPYTRSEWKVKLYMALLKGVYVTRTKDNDGSM